MTSHIVGGVLAGDEGALLVLRRADREHAPGTWSFPGGHVEPAEDPRAALERELREELGVAAVVEGDPYVVDVADATFSIWAVRAWQGTPFNAAPEEHDELRWITTADLEDLVVPYEFLRDVLRKVLAG